MSEVKQTLVQKILTVLGLNEEGKIQKFFNREIKDFERSIKELKQNIVVVTMEFSNRRNKLEEDLEDAVGNVDLAYEAVTVDKLASFDSMTSFSAEYWGNITRQEAVVTKLQKDLERLAEEELKSLESLNVQVSRYSARIAKIS